MTFGKWWEKNSEVYIALGIPKEIAQVIWGAAIDNYVKIVEGVLRSRF